jgi:EVE domain
MCAVASALGGGVRVWPITSEVLPVTWKAPQRAHVAYALIAEAHPDSTESARRAIDVAAVPKLPTPVSLERIKAGKRLVGMALVRISRLAVQPVSDAEWRIIYQMGGLVR